MFLLGDVHLQGPFLLVVAPDRGLVCRTTTATSFASHSRVIALFDDEESRWDGMVF